MNADMKRQRKFNAPASLFDPQGHSSLGSLPRGNIAVRRDTITVASVNQANDFKIGAMEDTREIPRSVLETGMRKFAERNATYVNRRQDVRFNISARQASFTPDALQSDGLTPNIVNATGQPIPQTRGPAADSAFVSGQGLMNPTNRVV